MQEFFRLFLSNGQLSVLETLPGSVLSVSEIYNIPATFLPSLLQPRTADFYRCCANYRSIFSFGATAKIVPRLPLFESFRPRPIRHTHPVELLSTND
jgi:hypothetical protein